MGNVEQCSSGSGVGLEQLSAATGGPDEGHEPVPALRGLAAGVASGAGRPGWRHHRPPVRHDVRLPPRSRGASPQVSNKYGSVQELRSTFREFDFVLVIFRFGSE